MKGRKANRWNLPASSGRRGLAGGLVRPPEGEGNSGSSILLLRGWRWSAVMVKAWPRVPASETVGLGSTGTVQLAILPLKCLLLCFMTLITALFSHNAINVV